MPIRHRIPSNFTELIAAVIIAALIVVVPAPLLAQQKAAVATARSATPVAADEEEESTPTSKTPGGDGIKVHGHWIIDVKDKDGKVIEHRDFQNALQTNGAGTLALLLTGQAVADRLNITVGGGQSNGYEIFSANSLEATNCSIPVTGHCVSGLTETVNTAGSVVLAGQFQATVADTFTFVATSVTLCVTRNSTTNAYLPDTVAPASCQAGFVSANNGSGSTPYSAAIGPLNFTSKDLTVSPSTPLSVAAGQSVSVTVTLSFS